MSKQRAHETGVERLRSAASRFILLLALLAMTLPACGGAEPAATPAQEPTGSVEAQPPASNRVPPATETTAPAGTDTAAALPPAVANA